MLQAESLKEKTVNRKTNTDHHNGDFFFLIVVSFTHFKCSTFKELI